MITPNPDLRSSKGSGARRGLGSESTAIDKAAAEPERLHQTFSTPLGSRSVMDADLSSYVDLRCEGTLLTEDP